MPSGVVCNSCAQTQSMCWVVDEKMDVQAWQFCADCIAAGRAVPHDWHYYAEGNPNVLAEPLRVPRGVTAYTKGLPVPGGDDDVVTQTLMLAEFLSVPGPPAQLMALLALFHTHVGKLVLRAGKANTRDLRFLSDVKTWVGLMCKRKGLAAYATGLLDECVRGVSSLHDLGLLQALVFCTPEADRPPGLFQALFFLCLRKQLTHRDSARRLAAVAEPLAAALELTGKALHFFLASASLCRALGDQETPERRLLEQVAVMDSFAGWVDGYVGGGPIRDRWQQFCVFFRGATGEDLSFRELLAGLALVCPVCGEAGTHLRRDCRNEPLSPVWIGGDYLPEDQTYFIYGRDKAYWGEVSAFDEWHIYLSSGQACKWINQGRSWDLYTQPYVRPLPPDEEKQGPCGCCKRGAHPTHRCNQPLANCQVERYTGPARGAAGTFAFDARGVNLGSVGSAVGDTLHLRSGRTLSAQGASLWF